MPKGWLDSWGGIWRLMRPILCCLLTIGLVAPLAADPVGAAAEIRITDISFQGDGVATVTAGETILWRGATTTTSIDISTGQGEGEGHYKVCLTLETGKSVETQLACQSRLLVGNQPTTVTFRRIDWPVDRLGRGTLTAVISTDTLAKEVIAESERAVVVLEKTGDFDSDGLPNSREFESGTAYDSSDTDTDGVPDGRELDPFATDPTASDTDSDGVDDSAELYTYRTDPKSVDTDGDGLHDRIEIFSHGTNPNRIDSDGDDLDDAAEVNAHASDPTDPDTDRDGLSDAVEVKTHHTDPTDPDTDDDGLTDTLEVAAFSTNPSAVDTDGDGIMDGDEVTRIQTDPTTADTDRDGLDDGAEVNEHSTDPNTVDTDADGLHDGPEVNRFGLDPTLADTDGDGVPDGKEVSRPLPDIAPLVVTLAVALLSLGGWWVIRRRWGPTVNWRTDKPADPPMEPPSNDVPADPSPLTNEDQVLKILETSGGRIKQSRIVDETEWSKSTVSRVLSRLEDNGQISKISLGRGNLITLPGEEPAKSKPPFENEARRERASR